MSNRTTPSPLAVLAAAVATRLHRTPAGMCRCGACNHQVRRAAARAGVVAPVLFAAITAASAPVPATEQAPRPRRPLTGQVGTVATVTVAGQRMSLAEGLLAVAARVDPGR